MQSEAVQNLNGTIWVFAALLIGMVIVQSAWYLKLVLDFNKRNGMLVSQAEIKQCVSTGIVASIGPSMGAIATAFALIVLVGPAVTFMRCGVIGAPGWELLMANSVVAAVGVEFNTPEFTESLFTLCIYGMTLASAPYFINCMITLQPMDAAAKKAAKSGGPSFLPILGNAALMSVLGYFLTQNMMKGVSYVVAAVASMGLSIIISAIVKKTGNKVLQILSMPVCMIVGMTLGQIFAMNVAK